MRVVAATFADPRTASIALAEIKAAFPVADSEIGVAALGGSGTPDAGRTLLAGRFVDDAARAIRRVVESMGGTVVADIDEALTHG